MAKKSKTPARRSRTAYLPWWPWPFWPPLVPATKKQLEDGRKLMLARGVFWNETFKTIAKVFEDLKKDLPNQS